MNPEFKAELDSLKTEYYGNSDEINAMLVPEYIFFGVGAICFKKYTRIQEYKRVYIG
ncbi:hypothetical protein [Paenibacillus radicis (ex Xue et al. 2023)]|uniref:Uncharacterized protein n=1 Tax=Paenibacillus radicis (ex Xue et al. 2023) TaxID=2972489 RepID=A0ABT1YH98_9BACL|nr:hypothetical protein [Paenibacillus radicis (ex Xue et al. 2023)]MCR8632105.1 hypothetical protein [Paenibacillus radicis (ex Xue et al. 2023)]